MEDLPANLEPPVLYHYCSTDTFVSIVQKRSIWLSSLTLSNDSMEGQMMRRVIMQLAREDGLSAPDCEQLEERLAVLDSLTDGLGLCLSEESDLLSQWRGYADDGRGVAIGFSRAYLVKLSDELRQKDQSGFSLKKAEYDPETHRFTVQPSYREISACIAAGALKVMGATSLLDPRTDTEKAMDDQKIGVAHCDLTGVMLTLFPHLFILKNPAFKEEKEWRLLSYLLRSRDDTCLHRSAGNRIIPYRAFELPVLDVPVIAKVVLGPKHTTPIQVVRAMLELAKFGDVPVEQSSATYR